MTCLLLLESCHYAVIFTDDGKTITLLVSPGIDLSQQVGRKIFAAGRFNAVTNVLEVTETSPLQIPDIFSPSPTPLP